MDYLSVLLLNVKRITIVRIGTVFCKNAFRPSNIYMDFLYEGFNRLHAGNHTDP